MLNVYVSIAILLIQLIVGMEVLRLNIIRLNNSIRKKTKLTFDQTNKFTLTGANSLFSTKHLTAKFSILIFIGAITFIVLDVLWYLDLLNTYLLYSMYYTMLIVALIAIYVVLKLIPYVLRKIVSPVIKKKPSMERSEYDGKLSQFWKPFKVLFIGFTFVPAMIVKKDILSTELSGQLFSTEPYYEYIAYLFPNQILVDVLDYYSFTIPEVPVYIETLAFTILMIVTSSIMAWIINMTQSQKFELKEYDQVWMDPLSKKDRKNAILLVHGLGANYSTWTAEDRNSNEDYNILQAGRIERIFALSFTDKLKNGLRHDYKIKLQKNHQTGLPDEIKRVKLSYYTWELFLSIWALVKYYNCDFVHLIGHSTGGIVIRDMFRQMVDNPEFSEIVKKLKIYDIEKNDDIFNQVTFLAVPHRGAKGASNFLLYAGISLKGPAKWLLGLIGLPFWILGFIFSFITEWRPMFLLNWIDSLVSSLVAFLSEAETPIDLSPKSSFLRELNMYNTTTKQDMITFYPMVRWKNASGRWDGVVGSGSQIWNNDVIGAIDVEMYHETFNVDHSGSIAFEDWIEGVRGKKNPGITYSKDVWNWVFQRETKSDNEE